MICPTKRNATRDVIQFVKNMKHKPKSPWSFQCWHWFLWSCKRRFRLSGRSSHSSNIWWKLLSRIINLGVTLVLVQCSNCDWHWHCERNQSCDCEPAIQIQSQGSFQVFRKVFIKLCSLVDWHKNNLLRERNYWSIPNAEILAKQKLTANRNKCADQCKGKHQMGLHSTESQSLCSTHASGHGKNNLHQSVPASVLDGKEEVSSTLCIGISSFLDVGHCSSVHILWQSNLCLAVFDGLHTQWQNCYQFCPSLSVAWRSQ